MVKQRGNLRLFSKWGLLLWDTALGIDVGPIMSGRLTEKKIEERLDFIRILDGSG
jgi:hypothetical protein